MESIITIGKVVWSLQDRGVGKLVTLTPLEGYGKIYQTSGEQIIQTGRIDPTEHKPSRKTSDRGRE